MRVIFLTLSMLLLASGCTPTQSSNASRETSHDGTLKTDAKSPAVTSMGLAQFAYIVSDEAGTPVIKGTLILPWPPPADSAGFKGTWQAKYSSNDEVSPANKLGPQTGGGACAGELSNGRLRINLNPGTNDNNVFFNLVIGESDLKGEWTYSTFTGPAARGSVVATRE